jgi:hypothetical protein
MAFGLEIMNADGKFAFSSDRTTAKLHSSYNIAYSHLTPVNTTLMSVNFLELSSYNRVIITPGSYIDAYGFLLYTKTTTGFTLRRTGVSSAGMNFSAIFTVTIWVA